MKSSIFGVAWQAKMFWPQTKKLPMLCAFLTNTAFDRVVSAFHNSFYLSWVIWDLGLDQETVDSDNALIVELHLVEVCFHQFSAAGLQVASCISSWETKGSLAHVPKFKTACGSLDPAFKESNSKSRVQSGLTDWMKTSRKSAKMGCKCFFIIIGHNHNEFVGFPSILRDYNFD